MQKQDHYWIQRAFIIGYKYMTYSYVFTNANAHDFEMFENVLHNK